MRRSIRHIFKLRHYRAFECTPAAGRLGGRFCFVVRRLSGGGRCDGRQALSTQDKKRQSALSGTPRPPTCERRSGPGGQRDRYSMRLGIQEIGLARKARNLPNRRHMRPFRLGQGIEDRGRSVASRPMLSAGMRAGLYQRPSVVTDVGPVAHSDRGDERRLDGEFVPGFAGCVDDVVVGLEDAVDPNRLCDTAACG